MFPKWPDALICNEDRAFIFYIQSSSSDQGGVTRYQRVKEQTVSIRIELVFNSDQSFLEVNVVGRNQNPDCSYVTACEGKSIDELYDQGLAFNLRVPTGGTDSYIFDYTIIDFKFDSPVESSLETERRSSTSGGRIVNCANGVTTDHAVSLELSIANTQSLTNAQSFTEATSIGAAVSVSVTATAEAGAIFASASVSATAGFEFSTNYEVSSTTEQSQTLEKVEEIVLQLQTTVSADPNTCAEYAIVTSVTREPVTVPYTATAQLFIFPRDVDTGARKDEPLNDLTTLRTISDLFPVSFNAVVDEITGAISFPVQGEYVGTYLTEQETVVANCDTCNDGTATTPSPDASTTASPAALSVALPTPSSASSKLLDHQAGCLVNSCLVMIVLLFI